VIGYLEGPLIGLKNKNKNMALHLEPLAKALCSRVIEIDSFDKCVIWCTIYNFFIQKGTVPTIIKLLIKLKDRI
jgi:hypothetical protein